MINTGETPAAQNKNYKFLEFYIDLLESLPIIAFILIRGVIMSLPTLFCLSLSDQAAIGALRNSVSNVDAMT